MDHHQDADVPVPPEGATMPELQQAFPFPAAATYPPPAAVPEESRPRARRTKKEKPRFIQQRLALRQTLRALHHLYKKAGDATIKDQIAAQAIDLLRRTAGRLRFQLPAHIDIRELEGWGVPGLLQAIESYDHHAAASFETHARARIHGAILDNIRDQDTVTRVGRAKAKKIERAVHRLQQTLLRQPDSAEVAAELNLSLEAYHQMVLDAQIGTQVINFTFPDKDHETFFDSLMDTVPDGTVSPETSVMTAQRNQVLRDTVAKLTNPAVWTVMEQHYFAERSLKEIAASLDMSESRASQLHNLGLNALRRTMKKRHLGADDFAIGHEVPTQYSAHSL